MKRTQLAAVSTVTLIAAAMPYLFSQQGQVRNTPRAALMADSTTALRIEFGVRDEKPRSWSGKALVQSGEIITIRNWRPRPGDEIASDSWKLATRTGANFVYRAWEAERLTAPSKYLNTAGVVIDVTGNSATELTIETGNGNFTVRPFDLASGSPLRLLDGNVIAERIPAAEMVSTPASNNDFPSVVALPQGRLVTAWVAFRDNKTEILTRTFDGRAWSDMRPIPANHADIYMVKLGREGASNAVAVWSAHVDGNWDLYASRLQGDTWTAAERLTTDAQPDIFPTTATDSKGALWVAWMGFRNGKSDVFARSFDGRSWSAEQRVSTSAANDWAPSLATDSKGGVYVAWDSYDKGNYDVLMRKLHNGTWSAAQPIADTAKFEANVSIACDRQDRLWAAWNESGTDWGKDTGFVLRKNGTPLYRSRWVAVAVHDGQRWMEPPTAFEAGLPAALQNFNDMPQVAADAMGRVWVLFRHRNLRIKDIPADTPAHRAAWEIHATTFEESGWREPMPVPFSQGREDMRFSLSGSSSGLYLAWPMDNRDYEEFLSDRHDVYTARLPLPGGGQGSLKLQPRVQPDLKPFPTHYEEAKDLARIHGYTLTSAGKSYKIYRGDTHRHTEFSMDGNTDGSLIDTYRYAIDAAELDFMLVSEHNGSSGPDRPYINWLLQQTADVFSVSEKFVPFFGYERSLPYPNGHRNVLFSKRGIPTLPIPPEEQKGQTGAKMLYEYLKKNNGIAISHTSATGMGTDWRDNDPDVEPLVEIYQGDRVSAEYEGAPKAAYAGNPASAPGGFRPAGYVWNAWAKGYKLGVQASSDHLSTHISYACTLTSDFTRQGLIDAMKLRHSYGATDNIILDYRMKSAGKEYLQGDIVDVKAPFELTVKVIGTQPVRQIDLIRGKQFLMTSNPNQREVDFSFKDAAPLKGESFYYVRVIQADDQMAWSSPIWVKR